MSSILSRISGHFSSSLILGTFLPVIVFVILFRLLVVPLVPNVLDLPLLAPLIALDEEWEVILILLVSIVLNGLLYNLNSPHIRFYEGYPWQNTSIGQWKKRRYQTELDTLNAQKEGLPELLRQLEQQKKSLKETDTSLSSVASAQREVDERAATQQANTLLPPLPDASPDLKQLQARIKAVGGLQGSVSRDIHSRFPKRSSILPTRLGNVIRSFENYPEWQYGMAAITLWPRLIAKIDPNYADSINEAKASFDFMLNSATLSALLALILFLVGLIYPASLSSPLSWLQWLVQIAICVYLAFWFYSQSIGRASTWGNLVKGAFDLYRWDLLKQLGYSRTPTSVQEEQKLWKNIRGRLIFGHPPKKSKAKLMTYTPDPTPRLPFAKSDANVTLKVARGISLADNGIITVTIEVRNEEPAGHVAKNLVITDMIPEKFDYEWGSARVTDGEVSIVGANPYEFHLDKDKQLQTGCKIQLTYNIIVTYNNINN